MNHDPIWITLEPRHIIEADGVAARKQNESRNWPGKYGATSNPETALSYHILGARCERAAKICFDPVYWNLTKRKEPDLDDFIDVKGRSLTRYDLMVPEDAHEEWVYLHVNAENHPHYEIVGWCWGIEAMGERVSDPAGNRPSHFISRENDIIKDPRELKRILRRHQARRAIEHSKQFEFIAEDWVWP